MSGDHPKIPDDILQVLKPVNPADTGVKMPGGPLRKEVRDFSLNPKEIIAACKHPEKIHPMALEIFTDTDFVKCLPDNLKSPEALALYLENCSAFFNLKYDGNAGIFGEEISLPESSHHDGRVRRAEEGRQILLDKVRETGVDPKYVLYFRVTQPIDEPKPEYYWTNDFYETTRGLRQEISEEKRKTSIILCSTLEDIERDGGLIEDINDDQGIAVRRINTGSYDQKRCLFTIKKE